MKRLLIILILLLLGSAQAEEAIHLADLQPLEEFAGEHAGGIDAGQMVESVLRREEEGSGIFEWFKSRARESLDELLDCAAGMIAPVVLLAVLGCVLRGGGGARFLVRLYLLLAMGQIAMLALDAAKDCLGIAREFSDVVAPAVTALLSAAGMSGSAALISPGAALVGDIAENIFLRFGLPLCRFALCTALAGCLTDTLDLGRITKLLRKTIGWGTGLCFTLFTALIALQGNVSASLDGVAVRTAKYAVDSAAPVIGSGVSDAWEAYVSGIMAAKSAVGVSGIVALLAAGIKPLLSSGAAMLLLHLVAAFMDVLGEKTSARAAEQVGSVCQMALELCTGSLAIGTILLGAIMAAGGGLLG
ncbi:MAG: hypothetical protein IJ466_10870 [Clostridia bacterium]|nr:hypothetical protein [Clostridia bacterium]